MIRAAFKTEKARRSANEDSCLVLTSEELAGLADGLYIVADGMGGRASGAVASRITVDTVHYSFISEMELASDPSEALSNALKAANKAVWAEAASKPELRGMGSTCVAVAVRGDRAFFAHVGDSRIYLMRDGKIRRLTEDHSFVAEKVRSGEITEEQARQSRFRNVITRAIGIEADAQPAVGSVELSEGDVILLCSDGLTGPVPDARIAEILSSLSNPEETCSRLVNAALRAGGSDNVTVIVAAYGATRSASRGRAPVRGIRASWIASAGFLALGLVLGFGLARLTAPKPTAPAPGTSPLVFGDRGYQDPVPLTYMPLQPGFLVMDSAGVMQVVDLQGRRTRVDTSGQVLATYPPRDTFKPRGSGPVQSAALDVAGALYVSDPVGKKILKFGSDGLFIETIGEGKLTSPGALAVGPTGDIFVIDGGRLKVIRAKSKSPITSDQ